MKLSEISRTLREIRVTPIKRSGKTFCTIKTWRAGSCSKRKFPAAILWSKLGLVWARSRNRYSPPARTFWRLKKMRGSRVFYASAFRRTLSKSSMATLSLRHPATLCARSGKVVGKPALLRGDGDALPILAKSHSDRHGVVDVTTRGRGASFRISALERLRNSHACSCRSSIASSFCAAFRQTFSCRRRRLNPRSFV